jgi:tRNA(Leu) C34 or U34 (ribose-2'-O)-methylase TrmL
MDIPYRRGQASGTLDGDGVLHGVGPAIVLCDPKYPHNVGQVVRLASCYGIRQVWSSGARVPITAHDKHYRLPREERMRGYANVMLANCDRPLEQFQSGTAFVAVEFVDNAESLPDFVHPERAVYVFGPEDGSLPVQVRKLCWRFVTIPTQHCLNLATAVASVLYDRATKVGFERF